MTDLLPFSIALLALLLTIKCVSQYALVQVYLAIVFCYLNLFPMASNGLTFFPSENFSKAQYIAIFLFEIPLFSLLAFNGWKQRNRRVRQCPLSADLSSTAPFVLLGLLAIFWFVSIAYDQFFVRLGYEAFLENPDAVPALLLFPYRITVEGSYFVILYLIFCLQLSPLNAPYRSRYTFTLWLYLITFITFFFVNSRMQFLLLLLCLYFVRPGLKSPRIRLAKLFLFFISAIFLVISLTLIREYLIESNSRLEGSNLKDIAYIAASLIADRLNSLIMLTRALDAGYDPFSLEISGLTHLWNLYFSFFTDPATYAEIRASEITSPSVEIINRILNESHVDFPKSMMLDVQLIFGSVALPGLAWMLARIVIYCQNSIINAEKINARLLAALFITPLLLQFEKETFGFLSLALKWSPLLVLLIFIHRLKQRTSSAGIGRIIDAESKIRTISHW